MSHGEGRERPEGDQLELRHAGHAQRKVFQELVRLSVGLIAFTMKTTPSGVRLERDLCAESAFYFFAHFRKPLKTQQMRPPSERTKGISH